MGKQQLLLFLVFISLLFTASCEKEEVFINKFDFNGTPLDQITSLLYNYDSEQNILYFSRFVEDGTINEEDYFYCIIDNALINTNVDILESQDHFEWYFLKDGYSYFAVEGNSLSITSGTFRIDREGENYYTVVADFKTFDFKTISIRWRGYFSYSVFSVGK